MGKSFTGFFAIGLGLIGLLTLLWLEHSADKVKQTKARADCETVLNLLKPFAEKQLIKYGSYYPFGAVLTAENKTEAVATFDGNEFPDSVKVIDDLDKAFRQVHKARPLLCTGIAYDVRLKKLYKFGNDDAIAVALNHVSGYSVIVYFPYHLSGAVLEFDESFEDLGSGGIFR